MNSAWPEFLSEIELFVLFVCCESRRWAISLIKNAFLLSEMLDCLSAADNDVIVSGSFCLYEKVVAGVVGLVSSVYCALTSISWTRILFFSSKSLRFFSHDENRFRSISLFFFSSSFRDLNAFQLILFGLRFDPSSLSCLMFYYFKY